MYGLKVHVPRLEKPITLPVLPPQGQVTIDMLMHYDDARAYRVVSESWGPEPEKEEASVTIDPQQLTGMKLGSPLPISRIATMLEQIQKKLEDAPIIENMVERIGVSRPGEDEWVLPLGVRSVLLPSPTWRKATREDTDYGDRWVRLKPSDEVVHQPLQKLRIVMDETVSEEDHARLREYFKSGSTIILHWHYSRGNVQRFSYFVRGESVLPKQAVILERSVKFLQDGVDSQEQEKKED